MIDFVVVAKIDDERRYQLFDQSIVTLLLNTPEYLINKLVIVNDDSNYGDFVEDLNHPSFFDDDKLIIRFNEKQLGVGGSKNKGVELAQKYNKGKYLYLFDGDVYFTRNWAENLIQTYLDNQNEYKLIGCGIHPFLQARKDEGNKDLTSHDAISGWSWFMHYEVWNKYGTLSNNGLGTGQSEDWEYCQRIRNDGYKVGCLRNQTVGHTGLTNTEGNQIVGYKESLELINKVAPESLYL